MLQELLLPRLPPWPPCLRRWSPLLSTSLPPLLLTPPLHHFVTGSNIECMKKEKTQRWGRSHLDSLSLFPFIVLISQHFLVLIRKEQWRETLRWGSLTHPPQICSLGPKIPPPLPPPALTRYRVFEKEPSGFYLSLSLLSFFWFCSIFWFRLGRNNGEKPSHIHRRSAHLF